MKTLRSTFIPEANATLAQKKLWNLPVTFFFLKSNFDLNFEVLVDICFGEKSKRKSFLKFINNSHKALGAFFNVHQSEMNWLMKKERELLLDNAPSKMSAKDSQARTLYDWEFLNLRVWMLRNHMDNEALTVKEMQDLADDVCLKFGLPPCEVNLDPDFCKVANISDILRKEGVGSSGMYVPPLHKIFLKSPDKIILLHELAHALHSFSVQNNLYQSHGPFFVRIVSHLYSDYLDIDLQHFWETAKDSGLIPSSCTLKEFSKPIGLANPERNILNIEAFRMKYDSH